ncbi:metal-sulfur cluster assembly factor, partial [Micromonospora sp. NPDC003776]
MSDETTTPETGAVATDGAATPTGGKAAIADIEEAMKDVVDPELGINVVDLGLVYGVHVDDQNVATLDMTLTSAACPLTDVIEDQARQALTTGPGGGLVDDPRPAGSPAGDRPRVRGYSHLVAEPLPRHGPQ